ncbi:hypothetical protein CKO38_13295 [Rhodospirillum rubrum]|uniref:ATP-binding protein n=1 Tax=Rhodospirillum rubrum TaxID=1085 RepID=UPI0019059F87|nr:YhaN family protein [Rhodospirillum rubrum]MBK1663035.1 hypothetical protein [Rhodospirillum rubrum]MBK1677625.1 hypothetical protein [Rhodospirillum rubrum]
MRIDRLVLERYGHFADHGFDFSGDGPRLEIIHGPNEAGKSTVLAALGDLLFGFPTRTPYNFRHDNPRLRLGASLRAANGRVLAFKRRKGTKKTLLAVDAMGAESGELPDNSLELFLGGIDRSTFETLFALDHARLRKGGEAMLATGGELAQSLFEAAGGTVGLASLLASLQAEADVLGNPGRKAAAKPYWQALDRYDTARATMHGDGLKVEAWSTAVQAVSAAGERRAALDEALRALVTRRSALERIRRIAPLLGRLDDALARRAAMGSPLPLPADFEDRWRAADHQARLAQDTATHREAALAGRRQELADLGEAGPLPRLAQRIGELTDGLGVYRKNATDHPHRQRDLDDALRRRKALLANLGLSAGDAAPKAAPSAPLLARVRALISQGARVQATLEAAKAAYDGAEIALRAAQAARLAQGEATPSPAPARAAFEAAQALGGEGPGKLARAKLERTELATRLAQALAALGRWRGEADTLAALAVPSAESVAQAERHTLETEAAEAAASRTVETTTEDLCRIEGALASLTATGPVPTADAVAQARESRANGWRLIRRHYVEKTAREDEALAAFAPDGRVADRFEATLITADHLADDREREAARIARFADLTGQRAAKIASLTALRGELEARRLKTRKTRDAWIASWRACAIDPGTPAEMRPWLAARAAILADYTALRQSDLTIAVLEEQEAQRRGHLLRAAASLGLAESQDLDTAALRDRVRLACLQAEERIAESRKLAAEEQAAIQRRAARAAERETAAQTLVDWQAAWSADMPAIGLSPTATIAEAEAALDLWGQIALLDQEREQTIKRRDQIADALGDFEARVVALLADLGAEAGDLPANDPAAAIATLAKRLSAAELRAARITDAAQAVKKAQAEAETARKAALAAAAALRALAASHTIAEGADALALARLSREAAELELQIDALRRQCLDQGDGLDEAALRAEASSISADAAAAEIAALVSQTESLQRDAQEAAQEQTEAGGRLRELEGGAGIGPAAQAASDALVDGAGILGRWLQLHAASLILTRAVERYRAANRHPVIERAEALFGAMVAGSANPIVSLGVHYGDEDRPTLVGIRADGGECPVTGMSEGTRDQLYLALRIATVERRLDSGEPLPFIADDLFVTSDEARTIPGLQALASLAARTQVLLFTHHRHVVDAARATLPADSLRIHALG